MDTPLTYSRHHRDLAGGAKAAASWILNPVSEQGAKQVFRFMFSVLGPEFHDLVEHMRAHEQGARLLRDKPDLAVTLGDRGALAALPEGSFGRAYYDFMSGPDVLPGYVLGGLAYVDGAFDGLVDWDEDAKYLVERLGNSHDMTHVLGGYGSDLAGEAILIPFQLTAFGVPLRVVGPLAFAWALFTAALFRPALGLRTWTNLFVESAQRGAAMAARNPGTTVPFEELLPLPLEEVHARLGVPPHSQPALTNPDGWMLSGGWLDGWLATQFASGFGQINHLVEFGQRIAPLVESGLTVRELMSVRRSQALSAVARFEDGGSLDEVRAVLA